MSNLIDILLGNDGLAALVAFALVLIPAVIIHELGHFFAGKSVGITILEFGVGFPPRIGRLFTWRGTEFTVNWLPLGGFVRPLGEDMVRQKGDEAEQSDRQEALERGFAEVKSVNEAKPLERILFLSAGAIANLISAYLIFMWIGALGVPGPTLEVASLDTNSPLYKAGLRSQDVIESVNGEFFLVPEDFFTEWSSTPAGETVELIARRGEEGEIVPISVPAGELSDAESPISLVRIVAIATGAPADEAGIQPGDLVLNFNGERVPSVQTLVAFTRNNLGQSVTLELIRDGEPMEVSLVPRENPPEGEGFMGIQIEGSFHDLGTTTLYREIPNQVVVQLSVPQAAAYGVERFADLFSTIANIPSQIRQGNISAADARPVSVVGISQAGGVFLRESIEQQRPVVILDFIALISIALGLTNLLPLPALDGGRILFVLIEMVRGRPIPPEREGVVHLLGLIFLLSVTVVVVINDIINPITNQIP